MNWRKLTAYLLITSMTATLFTGCKKEEPETVPTTESTVATTTESVETTPETTAKVTRTAEEYKQAGINELNSVPILMYHRIYKMKNSETKYKGGNVDKDGYNRTSEAFEADLRSFYEQGYRMMRLTDFVDGNIAVPFGYSPLILTFDDGIRDVVLEGWNDDGSPKFDDGCAIAILEKIKAEYPDYNVTATFFLNCSLFCNKEEDDKKLLKCQLLESIIPGQYVNIVALPYGSPEKISDDKPQYQKILSGTYEGMNYTTKATLLCAWTRSYSPFVRDYNKTAIRRIRAYDNDGVYWDIQDNFKQLNNGKRYISDGDPDTIVYPSEDNASGTWLKETYGHIAIPY